MAASEGVFLLHLVPVSPSRRVVADPVEDGIAADIAAGLLGLDPLVPLDFSALFGKHPGLARLAPSYSMMGGPIVNRFLPGYFATADLAQMALVQLDRPALRP